MGILRKCVIIGTSSLFLLGLVGCSNSALEDSDQSKSSVVANSEANNNQKEKEEEKSVVNPTFRNTTWGMSKQEVKDSEDAELGTEDDDILLYSYKLDGLDCFLFYSFIDDKLFKSGYMINEEHTNPTDYISDFKKLKDSLISKYGNPVIDDEIWKDDLYKDDPSDWGMAILTGDLIYKAVWDTDDTAIMVILQGDNFHKTFAVAYESKEYSDLNETKQSESIKNDL